MPAGKKGHSGSKKNPHKTNAKRQKQNKAGKTQRKNTKNSKSKKISKPGKKYSKKDTLMVFRTSKGKLVWLEKGNEKAGLQHVFAHTAEFIDKGISKSDIPDFIYTALTKAKIVGYQGKGTG